MRCVSWERGDPLPGCELAVGSDTAVSGADGSAELDLPAGTAAVEVHVRARGHVAVARRVEVRPGGLQLGDVRLRRGAIVDGIVTDPQREPYGDVRVRVRSHGDTARDDGWNEQWPAVVATADDGTFQFDAPLPAGRAEVLCEGAPPLLGSTHHALQADAANHLVLVCRASTAADWITGSVLDAGGWPMPDAIVQAVATAGPAAGAAARTNASGAFRMYRGDTGATTVWLTATAVAQDRCSPRVGPVPWGARDVDIELPAGAALQLFVSDAATGAPIEHFTVQCVRATGVRGERAVRRSGRRGSAGVSWIDDVAPGPGQLVVWPDDERWLPSPPTPFDHDGAGEVVRVALPRAEVCPVLVQTASGRPLAGVQVELLAPAASEIVRDLDRLFDNGGTRGPVSLRLARAATGADGRAQLRWHDDPRPLLLRVHGPGTSSHVETGVHIGPSGCTVVVPDTARLEVHLRGAGELRLVLQEEHGARVVPLAWAPPLLLDREGCGSADVPAGCWQVLLQRQLAVDGQASPVWLRTPAPLATVVLAAGETRRLELDATRVLAPAELGGTAFVDGEPAGTVVLLCGEPGGSGDDVRVRHAVETLTDARGVFRFTRLPPGAYALELRVRCGGAAVAVPHGEWLRLEPGERRVHAPIAVTTGAVRIRVRGNQLAGRGVELSAPPGIALLGTLDGNGEVLFERVPAANYRVRLRGAERCDEIGTLVVTGSAAPTFVFDAR